MKIIYAQENLPKTINKSIMLCGPTPRATDVKSWRNEALSILKDNSFDGVVFVPEPRDGKWLDNYNSQIEWEEKCLNVCDCIVFWVPRDLKDLPGFTTNVEFGAWADSGKIVFGAPKNAVKTTYLKYYANKYNYKLVDKMPNYIKEFEYLD